MTYKVKRRKEKEEDYFINPITSNISRNGKVIGKYNWAKDEITLIKGKGKIGAVSKTRGK